MTPCWVSEVPSGVGVCARRVVASSPSTGPSWEVTTVTAVTATYAVISAGYWPALVIGVVLILLLTLLTVIAAVRARRQRQEATSLARCRLLIAEAMVVRARVSGQIDAATYQQRMRELVSSGRS